MLRVSGVLITEYNNEMDTMDCGFPFFSHDLQLKDDPCSSEQLTNTNKRLQDKLWFVLVQRIVFEASRITE